MKTLQRYALSSLTSFLTGAIISVGLQFSTGITIEWSGAFWTGILIVAARAGVKAIVEGLAQKHADLPTLTG